MPDTRQLVIPVRLSSTEKNRLDEACKPKGLSRSAYVRMALMEKLWDEDQVKAARKAAQPK